MRTPETGIQILSLGEIAGPFFTWWYVMSMHKRSKEVLRVGALFLGQLAAAGLLRFQVLVKEIQRLLVRLGASHDGEHALTGVIVGRLGDRDPSSRAPPDLRDLGTAPADDAANHVRGNADVLGLDLLTILGDQGKAAVGGVGVGASAVTTAAGLVTEVGAVTGPVVGAAVVTVVAGAGGVRGATDVGAHGRVVEDGAGSSLPVIDQALADFPHSLFDAFGSSLHLDNALGRLREHFLLRNHAHARSILDVLDLKTLASDDGAHLVVGDEESHRCRETVSLVADGSPPGGGDESTYGESRCWRRCRPCPSGERLRASSWRRQRRLGRCRGEDR